jgi:hypothetical protein
VNSPLKVLDPQYTPASPNDDPNDTASFSSPEQWILAAAALMGASFPILGGETEEDLASPRVRAIRGVLS